MGESASPVAALSRLRISTAVSESKPNSWNALSGSMASGVVLPSTVAMCERTRSSSTACCSASGSPCRRCARADFDLLAASESSTRRRVGALIRSANIGGTADGVGAQRGQVDAGGRQEWFVDHHRGVEQFAAPRPTTTPRRRRGPAGPGRRRPVRRSCRWPDPTGPTPSEIAGNPWARRCAANPSRNELAAA